MADRRCEQCGTRMPGWKPRRRDEGGRLLCNGCHPEGQGPGEGRPVGHHGAVTAMDDDDDFGYPRRLGTDFACPRCGTVNKLPGEDESDLGNNANRRQCSQCGKQYMPEYVKEPLCSSIKPGSKMQCHLREGHSGNHEAYAQNSSGLRTWAKVAADGATDTCKHCGYPIKNVEDYGWIIYPASQAPTDDPARCSDPLGHEPTKTAKLARTAFYRDPIRALAMQFVAHDSGDGETIYHCPFCGGGQVTGRSDGTVECGFCQNAFTVQIQPVHPGAPQTINGQPVEWPGQPEGTFQPDREVQPGAETGGMDQPDQAEAPPGQPSTEEPAQAPGGGPAPERKNPVPPQFANASFVTQAGHVLDTEAYMRHLAIRFADNPQDVLAEVRAERR